MKQKKVSIQYAEFPPCQTIYAKLRNFWILRKARQPVHLVNGLLSYRAGTAGLLNRERGFVILKGAS
jgi:hypothetical protein